MPLQMVRRLRGLQAEGELPGRGGVGGGQGHDVPRERHLWLQGTAARLVPHPPPMGRRRRVTKAPVPDLLRGKE